MSREEGLSWEECSCCLLVLLYFSMDIIKWNIETRLSIRYVKINQKNQKRLNTLQSHSGSWSSSYSISSPLRPANSMEGFSGNRANSCSERCMLENFMKVYNSTSWCAWLVDGLPCWNQLIPSACCWGRWRLRRIFPRWCRCSWDPSHHTEFSEWWRWLRF